MTIHAATYSIPAPHAQKVDALILLANMLMAQQNPQPRQACIKSP
jgi:hypothetical protein